MSQSHNHQWSSAAFFPVSYHHSPDDSEMSGTSGGSSYGNSSGGGIPHNNFDFPPVGDTPYLPGDSHFQTRRHAGDLILPAEQPYEYDFSQSAESLHQPQQYSTGYSSQDWNNAALNQPQQQQQWTMGQQVQQHGYPQQYQQQPQRAYQMHFNATHAGHQNIAPLALPQHTSNYPTASPASSHSSFDSPRNSPGIPHHTMSQQLPLQQGAYPQPSRQHSAPLPTLSRASPFDTDQQERRDYLDPRIGPYLAREANIPAGRPISLAHLPGPWDDPAEKPSLSHRILMGLAIFESPEKQLTLSQIYEAMERKFAYYRDPRNGKQWQRSMRHSLSLYSMFENKQRPLHGSGKGGYWRVVYPDPNSPYKRERKRRPQGTPVTYDDEDISEDYDESDDSASIHSDSFSSQTGIRPGQSSRPIFGQSSMAGPSRPTRSSSSPQVPTLGSGAYIGPPVGQRQHHQVDMPERRSVRRGDRSNITDPKGKSRTL